jgi:hypothetical protein
MNYQGDDGQQLLGIRDCGDFVDVRTATSPNSYVSSTLTPDVALAAYEWLGRWLAAQGMLVRQEAQP